MYRCRGTWRRERERAFSPVCTLALKFPSRSPPSCLSRRLMEKISKAGGGDRRKSERDGARGGAERRSRNARGNGVEEKRRAEREKIAVPSECDPARDKFAQRARVRRKRKQKRFAMERERERRFGGCSTVEGRRREGRKGTAARVCGG